MDHQSKTSKIWEEFRKSVAEQGFIRTVTGSELSKEWAPIEARASQLPADYQEVWLRISAQYWGGGSGGVFDISKDLEFFDGILTMLEEGASDGLSASEFIGEDPEAFARELVGVAEGQDYRDKWRKQLNSRILKKLGRNK